MDLNGSNILVTGGAVRIGAAIATALAAHGARPIIHCRRSVKAARALTRRLRLRYGITAPVIACPLDTERDCRALIDQAAAATGSLDGLINNAAVFHRDALADADAAVMHEEFRVNLLAPIRLTRAFAATARRGAVVNLLDRRINANETGCLPYLLSKKALADFTRVAALELAPRFRVNGVAPGAVLPPPGPPSHTPPDLAGHVPLALKVKPSDVAAAVIYLLAAESVTGQIIFVDGGQHLLGAIQSLP